MKKDSVVALKKPELVRAAEAALREVKKVEVLLKYVVQSEQDKAEVLLGWNPELALYKGTVTDLSKRIFLTSALYSAPFIYRPFSA